MTIRYYTYITGKITNSAYSINEHFTEWKTKANYTKTEPMILIKRRPKTLLKLL